VNPIGVKHFLLNGNWGLQVLGTGLFFVGERESSAASEDFISAFFLNIEFHLGEGFCLTFSSLCRIV